MHDEFNLCVGIDSAGHMRLEDPGPWPELDPVYSAVMSLFANAPPMNIEVLSVNGQKPLKLYSYFKSGGAINTVVVTERSSNMVFAYDIDGEKVALGRAGQVWTTSVSELREIISDIKTVTVKVTILKKNQKDFDNFVKASEKSFFNKMVTIKIKNKLTMVFDVPSLEVFGAVIDDLDTIEAQHGEDCVLIIGIM